MRWPVGEEVLEVALVAKTSPLGHRTNSPQTIAIYPRVSRSGRRFRGLTRRCRPAVRRLSRGKISLPEETNVLCCANHLHVILFRLDTTHRQPVADIVRHRHQRRLHLAGRGRQYRRLRQMTTVDRRLPTARHQDVAVVGRLHRRRCRPRAAIHHLQAATILQ
jgi:hypothetical protein